MGLFQSIVLIFIYFFVFYSIEVEGYILDRGEGFEEANRTLDDGQNEKGELAGEGSHLDNERISYDEGTQLYLSLRNVPPTVCPRNDAEAAAKGQKCMRKCSSHEDCKSMKKLCLCDGSCGNSCIKPDRECVSVDSPENGFISGHGRIFNDKVNYTCDEGFYLVGKPQRTCQGDGSWSGSTPQCRRNIYCTRPPVVAHASHNAHHEQTTYPLEMSLTYQCKTGFITSGFPRAKCLQVDGRASWFGPDVTCQPLSCGPPGEVSNGWHSGDCYTLACGVTYHCAEGYEAVGVSEAVCQPNGAWSAEPPACILIAAVECPPPEHPSNGKAIYTSTSYNSVVSYECKYGFTLSGLQTRRCGADKKWTGSSPQCKEINCGHPGYLYNGWLENIESGTGLGASLIFRCHDNMKMLGNTSTICQVDGKWSYPLPLCLAPCVVPRINHGKRVILESTNETVSEFPLVVAHDEQLSIDCESLYEMPMNNTPVKCNNGTWSHIPACVPARCKTLPKPPKNGIVIAPKTDHGMKAKYKCKDGFTLRGSNVTECYFGNWTGDPPYCQQVYCPFPGYIENGKVMLVGNMGLYDYRPYVRKVTNNKQIMYDCDKGFALTEGPPGATCIDGQWSPKELPRCEPGLHPRLRWQRSVSSNGRLLVAATNDGGTHHLMNIIKMYVRSIGESLGFGNLTTGLTDPGESDQRGRRRRGVHLEGDRNTHGGHEPSKPELNYSGPVSRGWKRRRALLMGHQTQQRQQQLMSRRKNGSRPDSKKKNRGGGGGADYDVDGDGDGDADADADSDVEADKSGEGVTRLKSGRGKVPCEPLTNEPFFVVNVIRHGREPNATNSAGTVVQVSCGPGYGLNMENNTARCVRGSWKPVTPACTVLPCALPDASNGIFRLPGEAEPLALSTAIESGQVVEFVCRHGYSIQGPANLRCWQGQWDINALPECNPMPCKLPPIPNGTYLLGYRAGLAIGNGSNVQYTCDEHFSKTTRDDIECVLGELRPSPPSCKNLGLETWYRAGEDITSKGGLISQEGQKRACSPPARVQGSLIYKDGELMRDEDRSFPDGTEVTFNCVASIMGDRTTWRITCEDGSWVGRSMACDYELHTALSQERNSSCSFRNSEPNVVSFFNDQQITEDVVEFPTGSVLVSRCADIGKYAFSGENVRKCINGRWNASKPVCFGLNQENDYALDKPPTILFRHQLGPIAQSNEGKLIVYPGTVLHMECLWIRRFGTPKWNVSHEYRKYPEGWSTDPGRDSQLEYRLSIVHASKDDSGLFTCVTPTRHTHAIQVVVKAVHCPALSTRRGLTMSTVSTKMNARVLFSCSNGNALIGSHELMCLPSGNWSAPMPLCQSIECPDFKNLTDSNMRVSVLNREVGGRAIFSCVSGFGLKGVGESVCLPTGDWSLPLPTCQEVHCKSPGVPENGYMQGSGPYKAGDIIQYNCNPDFMMKGQPIIACQESGKWSGPLPKCVQACSYPGTTIKGKMSAVKFYYQIGENVTFTCDEGLELKGAPMLKCLKTGKWSTAIPTCDYPDPAAAAWSIGKVTADG